MIRPLLEFLCVIIFFIWGLYANQNLQPELFGMSIGLVAALLIEFISWLNNEWGFLKLYWDCIKPFQRNELRLSIGYLYNIEVQGKYLLVKSRHIPNTYQPVGGVYKYFQPEADNELKCMSIITDNAITNDDVSENDLRLKMRERKYIRKFLKWFFSSSNREWDPWREFYEELVSTGILMPDDFRYIHYELVGQHFEPIHYDTHFKIDTFKYADIYTPKFVTIKQKEEIKKLLSITNNEYIWVTEEEIVNKVTTTGIRIADHTYKIFHTKKLNQC